MNRIKSQEAVEFILQLQHEGVGNVTIEDTIDAVLIAEREADARAKKAFNLWCVETNPHYEQTLAGQREQDKYSELLKELEEL